MGELVWEAEEKKWTGALRSVSLSLLWVSPALPCKSLGIYLYNCISASLITSISVSLPGPCGSVCVQCLSLRGGISFFPKQVEGCPPLGLSLVQVFPSPAALILLFLPTVL